MTTLELFKKEFEEFLGAAAAARGLKLSDAVYPSEAATVFTEAARRAAVVAGKTEDAIKAVLRLLELKVIPLPEAKAKLVALGLESAHIEKKLQYEMNDPDWGNR